MTLSEATRAAVALTRELHAALEAGDLPRCEALLVRRAEAMVRFEDRHRAADAAARTEARAGILELQEADRRLQEEAAEAFAVAARDFQGQLGARPAEASAYGTLACLDRRG